MFDGVGWGGGDWKGGGGLRGQAHALPKRTMRFRQPTSRNRTHANASAVLRSTTSKGPDPTPLVENAVRGDAALAAGGTMGAQVVFRTRYDAFVFARVVVAYETRKKGGINLPSRNRK